MAAHHDDRSINGAGAPAMQRGAAKPGRDASSGAVLADTVPPTPLRDLLAASGASLYVLSRDTELIATVQRAGGGQYPVFAVATWEELEAGIVSGRCGIALLDSDALGAQLTARIVALERYASRVVTLVAADRAVAQELMTLLSERRIHRLLIKPPALGITRLLVESAVSRCMQLRERGSANAGDEIAPEPATTRPRGRLPFWVLLTAGAAGVVGVAAIVGVTALRQPLAIVAETEPIRAALAPTPPPEPNQEVVRAELPLAVDALFAQAEEALLADAVDEAAAALAEVRRAAAGSSRLAFLEAQLERVRSARAAEAVAAAKAPVASAAVVQASVAPAAPSELDSLLAIAATRLARGQLLQPAGDSAREYVDRALLLEPTAGRVVALRATLAEALLTSAREALGRGDLAVAAPLAEEAWRYGASSEGLAVLDLELTAAQDERAQAQHAAWFAAARRSLAAGRLAAPADDNALYYLGQLQGAAPGFGGLDAAWSELQAALERAARMALSGISGDADGLIAALAETPRGAAAAGALRVELDVARRQAQYLAQTVPASDLRLLAAASPVYPTDARARGIEGWVELEFVVDRDGRPVGLTVVQAEPPGRFDAAALEGVAGYRYAPFELDGRRYERRVRLRVRFALN